MNRVIKTITALVMCFMLLICNTYGAQVETERTITGITANNVKLSKADYNSTDAAVVAAAIAEVVKVEYVFDDEGGNVAVAAEDVTITANLEAKTALVTVGEFSTTIEYSRKASGYTTPTIGGGGGSTPKDEEPKEEEPKTEEPTYTEYDEYGIIIEKNIDNGVLKLKINNADGSVNTYDCANLVSVNGDMYNLIYTDILNELHGSIYAGAFVKLKFDGGKISSIYFNTSTVAHLATDVDAASGKYNVVATLVNSKPKHTILITAYLNNELKCCKFVKCFGQQIVTAELNGTYDTIKINAVNSLSSLKPLCKEKLYSFDIANLPKNEPDYKAAYILTAAETEGGVDPNIVQFKLLTEDDGIVVVDANSTFKYVLADETAVEGKIYDFSAAVENIYKIGGTATAADRIVKYELNSSNKLRSITAFKNTETKVLETGSKYNNSLGTIGGYKIAHNPTLFVVNTNNVNSSYITKVSALNVDNDYAGALLTDYNEDNQSYSVGVFSPTMFGSVVNVQGITAVATSATTTYEGDEANTVSVFFNNGEIPADWYLDDVSFKTVGEKVVFDEFIDVKLKNY